MLEKCLASSYKAKNKKCMYKEVEMTGFMFFQHVLVIFKGGFLKKNNLWLCNKTEDL